MDLTGKNFLAVHAESYADEQPADAVMVHYLWNNIRYIERGFDSVGTGDLMRAPEPSASVDPTGRAVANVNEMIIRAVPMQFARIPRRVVIRVWGYSGAYEISALLDLEEVGRRDAVTVSGFRYGSTELVIDLPPLTRAQSGLLTIRTRALEVYPTRGIPNSDSHSEVVLHSGHSNVYTDTDAENVPSYVGTQCTGYESSFSFTAGDHVYTLSDKEMQITGVSADLLSSSNNGQVYTLPYTRFSGYNITVDYDDDYFDAGELRANIPEEVDIVRRMAAIQSRQYNRPVLLAHGGQGHYTLPEFEGWPDTWRQEWSRARGGAGEIDLFRHSVDYFSGLSSVQVFPLIAGVHVVDPPFQGSIVMEDFGRLRAAASTARWIFRLKVEQYQDGISSPVPIASASFYEGIQHIPTATKIVTPLLQQAYLQALGVSLGTEYQHTYTEGRLQDVDFSFIDDMAFSVDVDTDDLEAGVPFDVVLTVEMDPDSTPTYGYRPPIGWGGKSGPPGQFDVPAALRLLLVGHSVYGRRDG